MLKLWGLIPTATCPLCSHSQCTLHHILVNCSFAREQKRYNWRHDSVLANIEPRLSKLISVVNERKKLPSESETTRKSFASCFVRAGHKRVSAKCPPSRGLLSIANDWQLLVDYDQKNIVFPPTICPASQRPDIVIWSRMSRRVILLELTCPAEEGMQAAQTRKETRYVALMDEIRNAQWSPELFTIEVGARGLVGGSTFRTFVKLGFLASEANSLCKSLSVVVARCSYAVYLAHNSPSHKDLLINDTTSAPSHQTSGLEHPWTSGQTP